MWYQVQRIIKFLWHLDEYDLDALYTLIENSEVLEEMVHERLRRQYPTLLSFKLMFEKYRLSELRFSYNMHLLTLCEEELGLSDQK